MKQRAQEELEFSFEEVAEILKNKISEHRGHDIEDLAVTHDNDGNFTVYYDSGQYDGGSYA